MKVYGELEVAQLEGFATVDLPDPAINFRRAVWDTTLGKLRISNGTVWTTPGSVLIQSQYTIGASVLADYTTLTAALTAHPSDASFLLDSSYATTENVTITGDNIFIFGQGSVSVFAGNITFASGSTYCKVRDVKCTGNVTFNAGSIANELSNGWIASTSVITDNGTNNYINVIQN